MGFGGNDCSKIVPVPTPPFLNTPPKKTTPKPDASQTPSNTYIRKFRLVLRSLS